MTMLICLLGVSARARALGAALATAVTFIAFLTPQNCHGQGAIRIDASTGSGASGQAENGLEKNRNELGLWVAGSLGLPSALGGSRDRKIPLLIGFRYGRVLVAVRRLALEYTVDVVPVALVSGPKGGFSNPGGLPSPGGGRDYVYGAGVIPLGFKLFAAPEHRIKPYLTISSGPFFFTKDVPVPDSARFNFISTAGGGVQIFLSSRRAVSIEYRVGHLSNAGVGHLNPGFNSSTVHVGFSFFK